MTPPSIALVRAEAAQVRLMRRGPRSTSATTTSCGAHAGDQRHAHAAGCGSEW
jgi:hypothetical protein